LRRFRDAEREDSADVRKEEILDRTSNEYEAIVAIAKEARRLNCAPGIYLDKGESAIPKAVENFIDGKVEYTVEGEEWLECPPEMQSSMKDSRTGRRKAGGKVARKAGRSSGRKK
jgi:DNA-directed RNA polymerase subunit K/omega